MNSVLIDLGFIKIYWYSFFICVGFVLGAILALREAKKKGIPKDVMLDYFFYLIPIVILGARLYYVLFNFDNYRDNLIDIFKVWEGGLAIHGGVITGIIWTYVYSKIKKINFFLIADIMVVSLILGQAIGRWGNFFNHEAHGPMIELATLQKMNIPQFIIDGMFIRGNYYEPTFFYESIWCLSGFIALVTLRLTKKIRISNLTSFYLVWYSIGRFYIESLRTDSLMFGGLKVAQIISICAIIAGIIIFIFSFNKKNKLY